MDLRRHVRLSCVVGLCALAVPAFAQGAGWSLRTDLGGTSTSVGVPRVAVDDAGNATLVWNRSNGSANDVQALSHVVGDAGWVGQTSLSRGNNTFSPQVAVGPGGAAHAAWRWYDGAKYRIQVASKPIGGAWSVPQAISTAGGNAFTPALAAGRSGGVAAIWSRHDGTSPQIETGFLLGGGAWSAGGADFPFLSPVDAETPRAGIDAAGNSVFLWLAQGSVESGYRRNDGFTTRDGDLTGGGSSTPALAVGENGTAVAVWVQSGSAVASAVRSGSGAWQSTGAISSAGPFAGSPRVAVDANGNAVAAWLENVSGHVVVRAATRPAGGAWTSSSLVSGIYEGAASPALTVDASGNAYVVWINSSGIARVSTLRTIGSATAWSEPGNLSPSGEAASEPFITASANGEAIATWVASRGASSTIDSAAFDVSGPRADASVPVATNVGTPLTFAGSATDDWSAIGAATWDFGDGSSAPGLAAQHTYTAPGTYTVTLHVTDAVGNAAAPVVRTIAVLPAGVLLGQPTVTVSAATARGTWARSRLRGRLRLSGTAARGGSAKVTLRSAGASTVRARWTVKVTAGAFTVNVRLPANIAPGRYTARVDVAGLRGDHAVRIAAPSEGVVSRSYIGGQLHGPPAIQLVHPSGLHAYFRFSALPARRKRVTVMWTGPGVRLTLPKNTARVIETYIASRSIRSGTWSCVLRVNGVVVKKTSVAVR